MFNIFKKRQLRRDLKLRKKLILKHIDQLSTVGNPIFHAEREFFYITGRNTEHYDPSMN